MTKLNNPYDNQIVSTIDSLVSDNKNNITEAYTIDLSSNTIITYRILSYQPSNDSPLSRVITYALNGSSYKISSDLKFGPYYNTVNPYYNKFRSLAIFCSKSNGLATVPYYYFHGGEGRYLSLSPRLCSSFNGVSTQINYDYNSDSLPVTCFGYADRTEYVKFNYRKVKK